MFKDKINIQAIGTLKISDKETGTVLVDKKNAIHPGNMAYVLASALGGQPIEYKSKTSSVGNPSLLSLGDSVMKMTARVLNDAKKAGAKVLVTACSQSHSNLDSYQGKAGRVANKQTNIPVVNLTEIIAFAFGHFTDRYAQLRTRAMIIGS